MKPRHLDTARVSREEIQKNPNRLLSTVKFLHGEL
jgi:hypothetical protein